MQVRKAGEPVVKVEYLSLMKTKINWYWHQRAMKQSVIISSRTVVHLCIEMSTIKYVADITSSICNINQALQSMQRQPFFISDSDHDYILDEKKFHEHIEYEIEIHNDDE